MLTNLLLFSRFQKLVESKWKIIPLLDRWILFELLPPLFFSIAAFTVVSLSVGVIFDLIRKIVEIGLPFSVAIQILLLKLPSFIVISFPMAMLLSTLLAYGSLNDNSEIKALKSIGISIYRLILPGLILSIFMFNSFLITGEIQLSESVYSANPPIFSFFSIIKTFLFFFDKYEAATKPL